MVQPRERDVLPLPLGDELRELVTGGRRGAPVTVSQRRRRRRHENLFTDVEDGVRALNGLAGGQRVSLRPVTACQRSAVQHLVECYKHAPTDEGLLSPLRAWESLQLQKSGYVHDVTDGVKAVYQPGNVSLPQGGAGLVDMMSILPPHLHAQLIDGSAMLYVMRARSRSC